MTAVHGRENPLIISSCTSYINCRRLNILYYVTVHYQLTGTINLYRMLLKFLCSTIARYCMPYRYCKLSDNLSLAFFVYFRDCYVLSFIYLTFIPSYCIRYLRMADEKFFLYPEFDWQRRYEALRASFVDRLPAKVVADRFNYTPQYIHLLRHQFIHEKIDFS